MVVEYERGDTDLFCHSSVAAEGGEGRGLCTSSEAAWVRRVACSVHCCTGWIGS